VRRGEPGEPGEPGASLELAQLLIAGLVISVRRFIRPTTGNK